MQTTPNGDSVILSLCFYMKFLTELQPRFGIITSQTLNNKFFPTVPWVCFHVICFGKLFSCISTEAKASAKLDATAQLDVGTIPKGSASAATFASITTSTTLDKGLGDLPNIPTILDFLSLSLGSRNSNSGVVPLFERKIMGSPL